MFLIQAFQTGLIAQDSLQVHFNFQTDSTMVTMDLKTNPEGAKVIIGSEVIGITPLKIKHATGKYAIIFKKDGFLVRVDTVNISVKKNLMIYESLLKIPYTNIYSSPKDADVLLDSIYIGRTPIDSLIIPIGDHALELTMNEFKEKKEMISITPGIDQIIDRSLLPTYGFVSFSVSPLDASISLDNNAVVTGDITRLKLKTGWHYVSVHHPISIDTLTERFYVEPSGFYEYKAGFNKFSWLPFTYSAIIPGLGQIIEGSYIKGSLEFLITAGTGYFLSDLEKKKNDNKWTFFHAQDDYNLAGSENQAVIKRTALEEAASNYNRARNNVSIAFAVLGFVYAINLVDVLLFNSKLNEIILDKETIIPVSKIKLFENGGNVNLGMQIQF